MADYELKSLATKITVDELSAVTIKNRMNAVYAEMSRNMNTSMYGDREPPRQLTRRERMERRVRLYRNRIKDAWLVLTGRAEIGDGW